MASHNMWWQWFPPRRMLVPERCWGWKGGCRQWHTETNKQTNKQTNTKTTKTVMLSSPSKFRASQVHWAWTILDRSLFFLHFSFSFFFPFFFSIFFPFFSSFSLGVRVRLESDSRWGADPNLILKSWHWFMIFCLGWTWLAVQMIASTN